MIEARGDQDLIAQPILKVDHVSVVGSATWGVSLRGSGAFTADSQALTISGSAKEAMRILPRLATNIPSGSYTGNAVNAIMVETEAYGDVNLEDVTFHNRGVPYHVGGPNTFGTLRVGSNPVALTIEAGVTMAFSSTGTLSTVSNNGSTGAIVAAGSATQPIIFTSVSPTSESLRICSISRRSSCSCHSALRRFHRSRTVRGRNVGYTCRSGRRSSSGPSRM